MSEVIPDAEPAAEVAAKAQALGEAMRVLRPGGRLVVATLAEHRHGGTTAAYGHVNRGFKPAKLRRLLERIGFEVVQSVGSPGVAVDVLPALGADHPAPNWLFRFDDQELAQQLALR